MRITFRVGVGHTSSVAVPLCEVLGLANEIPVIPQDDLRRDIVLWDEEILRAREGD